MVTMLNELKRYAVTKEIIVTVDVYKRQGKASVTSPTLITVKNGEVTADIQWSSSNYDYMIVDGEKYLPVNEMCIRDRAY